MINLRICKNLATIIIKMSLALVPLLIFSQLIISTPVHAQSDPLKEDLAFMWGTPEDEEVYAMEFISDEIVYIAGDMGQAGKHRFFLTRLNVSKLRSGSAYYDWSFNWERSDANGTFGDMMIDSSGNIYIVGTLHKNNKDIFLMRFNSAGTLQWNLTWGTPGHESTRGIPGSTPEWQPKGKCLIMDSTNNVYVVGKSGMDVVLIKYNSLGVYQWNQTWNPHDYYGAPTDSYCQDVEIDSNNNIYIAMAGEYFPSSFLYGVLKSNTDGVLQWNTTFYSKPYFTYPGILIDSDGLFYYSIAYLTKFGLNTGDRLWNKTVRSGEHAKMDFDSLGNLIILERYCLLNTFNSDGIIQINYTDPYSKRSKDFSLNSEGDIFILSRSINRKSSVNILKFNSNGEKQYDFYWGLIDNDFLDDFPSRIFVDSSDKIYVSGKTLGFEESGDFNIFFVIFSRTIPTTPTIPFDLTITILTTVGIAVVLFIRRRRKLT